MDQPTFADLEYESKKRKTRREIFLDAVGLEIEEPELTEVMHSLNAILQALDEINPPGLEDVEPLPIIMPPK